MDAIRATPRSSRIELNDYATGTEHIDSFDRQPQESVRRGLPHQHIAPLRRGSVDDDTLGAGNLRSNIDLRTIGGGQGDLSERRFDPKLPVGRLGGGRGEVLLI